MHALENDEKLSTMRKEYTKEIVHLLRAGYKKSFIEFYKSIKATSPRKYVLRDYQDFLRSIPKWNKEQLFANSVHFASIIDRYKVLTKKMCKVTSELYDDDIDSKVIHMCFVEIARHLFRNPIFVYDEVDTQAYLLNLEKMEKMIHHCIKSILRSTFPQTDDYDITDSQIKTPIDIMEETNTMVLDNRRLEEETCTIVLDNRRLEEETCTIVVDKPLEEETCTIVVDKPLEEETSIIVLDECYKREEETSVIVVDNRRLEEETRIIVLDTPLKEYYEPEEEPTMIVLDKSNINAVEDEAMSIDMNIKTVLQQKTNKIVKMIIKRHKHSKIVKNIMQRHKMRKI